MKNRVLLVDQTRIPASCDCVSLFVNDTCILEDCDQDQFNINEMASILAVALQTHVKKIVLEEVTLAKYMAALRNELSILEGEIKNGKDEFYDWVQGYTNDDVLGAIESLISISDTEDPKPMGLDEALKHIFEDDPELKFYETEIGLFDLSNDPNTAFESHVVVVAAESKDEANEQAQQYCEQNIPVIKDIAFSPMTVASEVSISDYHKG